MEATADNRSAQAPGFRVRQWLASHYTRDLALIIILMLIAVTLRAWQLGHTEVTSPDGIDFIQYAWQLEHRPLPEVLRTAQRHPGYPAAILVVSLPLRHCVEAPQPLLMQWSALLASALASVVLVLPMFYLGRELFDRFTAFGACLLFQCFPASCQVLGDALSEAIFLLFTASALLAAVRGLRTGSVLCFALCGLMGGLAYWTRPEGLLIVAATGLMLLVGQVVPAWRKNWPRLMACGLSLTMAVLGVASPFVALTGRLTVKPTARAIINQTRADNSFQENGVASRAYPLLASLPASPSEGGSPGKGWWGLWALCYEVADGFFYVAWLPAGLGLWWFRQRFAEAPGAWVLLLVCGAILALLWRVAVVVGYVSDRHLLLVVFCGLFWAVAALRELPRKLSGFASRWRIQGWMQSPFTPLVLVLLLAGAALPKSLTPPHPERAGYRAAGAWLAEHAGPKDIVVDPYHWAAYHSGKLFQEKQATDRASEDKSTQYVVLPRPAQESARRPMLGQALKLAAEGEEVYSIFVRPRRGQVREIVVFAVPPQ